MPVRLAALLVILLLPVLVTFSTQLVAQDPESEGAASGRRLTIGDTAPALEVSAWLRGEEFTEFRKGHVYIIDFWATWCRRCQQTMPHLSMLQDKYRDQITVLGVSLWEHSPDEIEGFVTEHDLAITYSVARDRVPPFPENVEPDTRAAGIFSAEKGAMSVSWMAAAARETIPCAFIIDGEGKIAWIGDPLLRMDDALARIVAGDWDRAAALAAHEQAESRLEAVRKGPGLAKQFRTLTDSGQLDSALELALEHIDNPVWQNDSDLLNNIAWAVVDPEGQVVNREADPTQHPELMKLARKAADRANQLTGNNNPNIVDTLARVYYLEGDLDRALQLQRRSVQLAASSRQRGTLQATLEEYLQARAVRDEKAKKERQEP